MVTYIYFQPSAFRPAILAFPQHLCVATPLKRVPYGALDLTTAPHRHDYSLDDAQAVCDWLNQRVEYHKNLRFHPSTAGAHNENLLPRDPSWVRVCGVRCEQPGNRDHRDPASEPQSLRAGPRATHESTAGQLTTPFHSPAHTLGSELDSGAAPAIIDPLDGSRGVSSAPNSGTPAAGADDLEGGDITLSEQELAEATLLTSRESC